MENEFVWWKRQSIIFFCKFLLAYTSFIMVPNNNTRIIYVGNYKQTINMFAPFAKSYVKLSFLLT